MKIIPAFAIVSFCIASAGAARAQGAIEPGTEFPAAPISKGGISLAAPSQIIPPAPPPTPVVAPAPAPAPKVHRRRRKSS